MNRCWNCSTCRTVVFGALMLSAGSEAGLAQGPPPTVPSAITSPCPPGPHFHRRSGLFRSTFRCAGDAIHEHFIGDPALFDVPPLGYDLYRTMGAQVAKANMHTFMLYRSDFLAHGEGLSPNGARRLSFLASELAGWSGPIVIEWTPDLPELAESRRGSVLALLQGSGVPLDPARVLVGPSPYRGALGVDASNNYDTLIYRDLAAPRAYSLTPSTPQAPGGSGR